MFHSHRVTLYLKTPFIDFISNQNVGGCYYYGTDYPEHLLKNTFDGQSFRMNDQLIFSYKKSYPIGTITLPTVVLIGKKTGSSGEGLALVNVISPLIASNAILNFASDDHFFFSSFYNFQWRLLSLKFFFLCGLNFREHYTLEFRTGGF